MKKKAAMEIVVIVRLTEDELRFVQLEMELTRKPTPGQVKKFFDQAVEHELERLAEEHDVKL